MTFADNPATEPARFKPATGKYHSSRTSPFAALIETAGSVILGKTHEIKLAFVCLLAGGHLLIEDLPGVGKTTLAHLLARLLGLQYARIQFTSDMLPADVLGVSVYDRAAEQFRFHPGPVFAQLVLADEINRATPKAQSALLEAMEERQVTADGETRALPRPFFVIATQNPAHQIGTFPLPESQLDRFLMRIALGYPDQAQERILLAGEDRRAMVAGLQPLIDAATLMQFQARLDGIHAAPPIIDYCLHILHYTRSSNRFRHGLSPRAGLGLLRAARAWAMVEGRDYVAPDDIQQVLPAVVPHRLAQETEQGARTDSTVAAQILDAVPIP
ncbi:MoxR family ATPase [Lamprobacter modestohalophilus]|uniref:AAA family ATPase n=1 Tax=Lamprobacter modestohalophilus TaxID=1064514 RepID=UPI002ADEBA0F|nr:MoxR family ATPase [Lamprobacter modestohalophilus]MEA1050899.1 MoxR family ATPase [Lamprobacter modestohalophilus]